MEAFLPKFKNVQSLYSPWESLRCDAAQNPEAPSPPPVRGAPKPQYSEAKKEEFRGYAWIPARDPSLLDQRGCQILLIGARPDIASAPGRLHRPAQTMAAVL